MAEKVIFEGKLKKNQSENRFNVSLNEQQAAANIAKSLLQDFMFLITVAGLKAVFATFKDKEQFVQGLRKMWKDRTDIQLTEETKTFQNSIFNAMNSEASVDEQTTKQMNDTLNSFNNTRDNAVKIAEEAVDSIIKTLLTKEENTNEKGN